MAVVATGQCESYSDTIEIFRDRKCVFPGDVNNDGFIFFDPSLIFSPQPNSQDTISAFEDYFLLHQIADTTNSPKITTRSYIEGGTLKARPQGCYEGGAFDWGPKRSFNWPDSLKIQQSWWTNVAGVPIDYNLKYADCDGDGKIDETISSFYNPNLLPTSDGEVISYNYAKVSFWGHTVSRWEPL